MKIYVGHDSREDIAYQVCEHSIKRRDPSAEVIPLKQKQMRDQGLYTRPVDKLASTEFTFNSQLCLIKNLLNSNTLQIVTAAGGIVITDNIGSYNANDGTVTIQFFNPTALSGGETQLKLSVVPANQSVLAPVRNDRFVFDPTLSVTTPVTTDAAN